MIRAFLEKVGILSKCRAAKTASSINPSPLIIPRSEHGISRAGISANALKVLYRLHNHGYSAYLVGGGVRDLLLGLHPKDFDVVTNADPEAVRRVFRNCRLIGRRFRLAHVYFGHDIVEVATFRGISTAVPEEKTHSEQGMILRDNVYGTMAEDVWRRDFTINALYYNIADFSLVDYCGGYADLKAKKMRMIGEPLARYREDPVRMLRAIRFACKVGFALPAELTQPMVALKGLINHVSSARLFEEMMKLFHAGKSVEMYENLVKYNLFEELFPATAACLNESTYPTEKLLKIVFENTDKRITEHKTVTPAFIIAALLWHPICVKAQHYIDNGMEVFPARMKAIEELLALQAQRVSFPKRLVQGAREIWLLQMRLMRRHTKRVQQLMTEHRFRAALDFLELRAKAGEPVKDIADWWLAYVEGDAAQRQGLIKSVLGSKKRKKKRAPKVIPPNPQEQKI